MKAKSDRDYAEILYGLTTDLNASETKKAVATFTDFLAKEQVVSRSESILNLFAKLAKERSGVQEVKLMVARELPSETLAEISKALGKKVELEISIDPSLIGGFVAVTPNERLDASIKGRIERFASHLIS